MSRRAKRSVGEYYLLVLGLATAVFGLVVVGLGEPAVGILVAAIGGALVCLWFSLVVEEDAAAPYLETIDGRPVIVVEVPGRRQRLRRAMVLLLVGGIAVSSAEFGALALLIAFALAAVTLPFVAGSQRLLIDAAGVQWKSGLVTHQVSWDQIKDGKVKRDRRGFIALAAGGHSLGLDRFQINAERWAARIIAAGKDPRKRDTLYLKLKVREDGRARSRQAS